MLSAIDSEKRNVSCGTYPIALRRTFSGIFRTSTPSMSSSPPVTSYRRGIRFTIVLFPEPVYPTTASVRPAGIVSEIPLSASTAAPAWRNMTFRNSIVPLMDMIPWSVPRIAGSGSRIAGSVSMILLRRAMEADPCWSWLITQPKAIIGQMSITW